MMKFNLQWAILLILITLGFGRSVLAQTDTTPPTNPTDVGDKYDRTLLYGAGPEMMKVGEGLLYLFWTEYNGNIK